MPVLKTLFFVNTLSLVFLSSCISTQAYWKKKDYQPIKGGVVYYNPNPSLFDETAVDQRKQDAEMKMIRFCNPQKPNIVSERLAEEITGQYTSYSSSQNNPSASYYSHERTKKDGSSYKKSGYYSFPWSSSSGSATSTNLVRNRIYITFQCE